MWTYIAIAILSLLLATSSYFCLKFAFLLIEVQESVEDSIQIMDIRYESISNILTTPLFYDSQEVRQVLDDIKISRDAILEVAKTLSINFETKTEESSLNENSLEEDS